jgi:hypothetical protein
VHIASTVNTAGGLICSALSGSVIPTAGATYVHQGQAGAGYVAELLTLCATNQLPFVLMHSNTFIVDAEGIP